MSRWSDSLAHNPRETPAHGRRFVGTIRVTKALLGTEILLYLNQELGSETSLKPINSHQNPPTPNISTPKTLNFPRRRSHGTQENPKEARDQRIHAEADAINLNNAKHTQPPTESRTIPRIGKGTREAKEKGTFLQVNGEARK